MVFLLHIFLAGVNGATISHCEGIIRPPMANRHLRPLPMPCPDSRGPLHTSIFPHSAVQFVHKPPIIITFNEALVSLNAGYLQKMVLYEGEQ